MTDHPIDPSILEAIEQGRGQRGRRAPKAWSRHRAKVLTAVHRGMAHSRIAGELGLGHTRVKVLRSEACDAVLRGGSGSEAADAVCAKRWRDWCDNGDTEACDRLQRG